MTPEQKKRNARTGWILASVALQFGLGLCKRGLGAGTLGGAHPRHRR